MCKISRNEEFLNYKTVASRDKVISNYAGSCKKVEMFKQRISGDF